MYLDTYTSLDARPYCALHVAVGAKSGIRWRSVCISTVRRRDERLSELLNLLGPSARVYLSTRIARKNEGKEKKIDDAVMRRRMGAYQCGQNIIQRGRIQTQRPQARI